MKRIVSLTLGGLIIVTVSAMAWQHERYAQARRDLVQDYQDLFHGEVFHVLTFIDAVDNADLLADLRTVRDAMARHGKGQLVYAGKVIYNGLASEGLDAAMGRSLEWDAVILQQFDSRDDYADYLREPAIQAAFEPFPATYAHGFRRSAGTNLALPQVLLATKIARALTLADSPLPFEDGNPDEGMEFPDIGPALLAEADGLGRDAVLIVNLIQEGDSTAQSANANYANNMLGLMADAAHGPLHVGLAESIDHPVPFDSVALVYYPGSRDFRDLIMSRWYQALYPDKQLADTLSCVTVPITDLL